MSNWTRAKDAWIARKCEGWHQIVSGPQRGFWQRPDGVREVDEPSYLTDPAAAIRAAEAWQLKDVRKRSAEIRWCGELKIAELMDYSDDAAQLRNFGNGTTVAAALAQALLRATGGPV